jgi:hypothetical protein
METITINGIEYNLIPIEKQSKQIILKQTLEFEVYPKDLGRHNWKNAKKVCEDLGDGWRLPTREELHLIWLNKDSIGGFVNNNYWSSTEYNLNNAWVQLFGNGEQNGYNKNSKYNVRAVRDVTI